jgi:hypothetical protein
MLPGDMQLMRMLLLCSSLASTRVTTLSAAFDMR